MRRGLGRLALGVGVLAAAATAWAHAGGSTGYASITVSRGTVRYRLLLPASALPSPYAEMLRLAQAGSQRSREELLDVLRNHIVLRASGIRCEPGPGQLLPSAVEAPSFTMQVDFACGSVVRALDVQDDIFDVLGPDHHTLEKLDAAGSTQQFAFAPLLRLRRRAWAFPRAQPPAPFPCRAPRRSRHVPS